MNQTSFARRAFLFVLTAPLVLAAGEGKDFVDKFDVPKENFVSVGKNPYCVLEPGYQMSFEGTEKGKKGALAITVLDETKTVDGVETRVVEERESADGQVVEVSRNFFAMDKKTHDVFYFGEEVDMYKNGKLSSHEGAWQSGKNGARFGLFMPGAAKVGQRFYQELAPKEAMDRFEILSLDEKVSVPAGTFEHCLKTRETTPLEADEKEYKLYAPGVGLLVDGELKLVKFGKR